MDENSILQLLYDTALKEPQSHWTLELDPELTQHLESIVDLTDRQKAVLAVVTTLLLKKVSSPDQDIRLHQASMPGGFSGRSLDTKVVTPFLKRHDFPAMLSGSGWLTRSLEQSVPYTLDYPGGVKPNSLKSAFLNVVDMVQSDGTVAEPALLYLLRTLIERRDRDRTLKLARPINLTDSQIVGALSEHFSSGIQGTARLPVLAIHAIMSILVEERGKYEGCLIASLESHTSADSRSGHIGDVHIVDEHGRFIEVFEVKHDIAISERLITDCFSKYRHAPVRRFYILTTHKSGYEPGSYGELIERLTTVHGCQLIVNGVEPTIKYFLRIVSDTRQFVDEYVSHLESDPAVSYELKMKWNSIVGMSSTV